MKILVSDASYSFSWEQVVTGFWKKYQILQSKRILSNDVIFREVEGNKLTTKRLIRKTDSKGVKAVNALLFWVEKPKYATIIEESVVDLDSKTFTTYTRNISEDPADVIEKSEYKVHPKSHSNTIQDKIMWIESNKGFVGGIIETTIYNFLKTFRARKTTSELTSALELLYGHKDLDNLKNKALKAGRFAQKNAKTSLPK